jgi:hypothetical protein
MKLAAISRLGLRRDFGDLFEILGAGVPLRECGEAYLRRFGIREADLYHVLRALTYFDDAKRDPVFPRGMDEETWEVVKGFFRREAPKLLREEAWAIPPIRSCGVQFWQVTVIPLLDEPLQSGV